MAEDISDEKAAEQAWAYVAFQRFLKESKRLKSTVEMEEMAIDLVVRLPKLLVRLKIQDEYALGERLAKLAKEEVDSGFSLVYSNAVVALWSRLETTFRDFVGEWLRHRPEVWKTEPLSKLRVRVGDYMGWSEEDRSYYLAVLVENELAAGLRNGVDRFESLIEALGLGGGVDDVLRRDLFELAQVRNVIVHCGGIADRRLVGACSWLRYVAGDEV